MKFDASPILAKSLSKLVRVPQLWAFGAAISAMWFCAKRLRASDLGLAEVPVAVVFHIAVAALLVGLTRQCFAVMRGDRPDPRQAFATVRRNLGAIVSFGVATWMLHDQMECAVGRLASDNLVRTWFSVGRLVVEAAASVFLSVSLYAMLPVLARESVSAPASMRRTGEILILVWRPRLFGLVRIGLGYGAIVVALGLLCIAAALAFGFPTTRALEATVYLSGLLGVPVVVCDQLFDAGVYLAATEGADSDAAFALRHCVRAGTVTARCRP